MLVREGIGNLVIGKNDGWKQNIALGKRGNQNFVSIPHARLAADSASWRNSHAAAPVAWKAG